MGETALYVEGHRLDFSLCWDVGYQHQSVSPGLYHYFHRFSPKLSSFHLVISKKCSREISISNLRPSMKKRFEPNFSTLIYLETVYVMYV